MQRKSAWTLSIPPGAPDAVALIDQIIDCAPVGMAVIDADGLYRRVNPAYCALYGYTADDLIGSRFTRVFPPAQQAQALASHQAFLVGGQALDGELEVRRHDGRALSVLAQSVRVPGVDGRPQRLVYVMDISQRAQVERAVQASQQFLQSVLDGLPAHVCVLDEAGTVLAANRAWREFGERNGMPPGRSTVGTSYLAVCDQAARAPQEASALGTPPAEVAAQLRAVLAGTCDAFQAEYPCNTVDGPQWFLARISRIAGSQPPRTVVAHDNITALKQAQDTLRDGQAMLLDMAASIPGAMFRMLREPDGRWRFTYFSPGLLPLFGLTPEQACADIRALGRVILPEDRAAHDETIRAAVAAGRPFEQEYRIRTADGAVKWVHATAMPQAGSSVWTGLLMDISARKQLESVVRDSEERYRTLFETVAQGVVYQDAAGRITSANPAAQRILGLTLDQMKGRESIDPRWQAVREDGSPFPGDEHPAMVALRSGAPVHQVVMGVQAPGRGCTWLLVNATPVLRGGVVQEVYSSFEDITERVLLSQELKLQASTDYLTGAANRRSLMQRLALEFERVQRLSAYRCALLAVDLDLFKQVNDRHGHAAGDAVLQHVAALMRRITRQHDLVARSGGEEFTLLLPDTGPDEAAALAERLRAGLQAQPVRHAGPDGDVALQVTVSVGVSLILPGDASLDAVLARADAALYQAKAGGRNQVCVAPSPG
jgi:diguanylate cyclase (GGDEF)-like protein/PAS domain S-box-containing protein